VLTLPPGVRVFVATERVDGRKGMDGLSVVVRSRFAEDPLSGTLFVFFSRRADRVRVLYWDRDGYVLVTKRLEKGTYRLPWRAEEGRVIIEAAELLLVLEGIELRGATRTVGADFACAGADYFVRSFFVAELESSFHRPRARAQRSHRVWTEREAFNDHERARA
jgi:transposase